MKTPVTTIEGKTASGGEGVRFAHQLAVGDRVRTEDGREGVISGPGLAGMPEVRYPDGSTTVEFPSDLELLGKAELAKKLVKLVQCCRRACSYVLTEDERAWKPTDYGERAICPICGEESFYTLKANGQKVKMSERDEFRNGIDPHAIEPTPRMGPKMKAYLRDAKKRALAAETDSQSAGMPG